MIETLAVIARWKATEINYKLYGERDTLTLQKPATGAVAPVYCLCVKNANWALADWHGMPYFRSRKNGRQIMPYGENCNIDMHNLPHGMRVALVGQAAVDLLEQHKDYIDLKVE